MIKTSPKAYVFVFLSVTTAAAAPQAHTMSSESVLHNFQSPPNGVYLDAGVLADSAGNLYGTSLSGGKANKGVVFKVDPSGRQTVLYSFTGSGGSEPRRE